MPAILSKIYQDSFDWGQQPSKYWLEICSRIMRFLQENAKIEQLVHDGNACAILVVAREKLRNLIDEKGYHDSETCRFRELYRQIDDLVTEYLRLEIHLWNTYRIKLHV
jgi:hypothetical protein